MKRINFQSISQLKFDLIVIGGGITGAAVAHEAALQGRSVALFEMNDFGSATSSATSKLIHGGLRYLKNLELGLVRESLRERRILGDIAPNLVEPLRFLVPKYKGPVLGGWALKLGMLLYDRLSFDKANVTDPKNRLLSRETFTAEQTLERAPMLESEELSFGLSYFDYANINPDRMTLAFLKTAYDHGAALANYAKVEGLLRRDDVVHGVTIIDRLSGSRHAVQAGWVINCAGPWADTVIDSKTQQPSTRVRSEGVHLLTSKIRFRDAVALQTRKGDHVMFLPWRGVTIVGPTDKPYRGDPDSYAPTKASVDELINKINAHIPAEKMGGKFTPDDILYHYGGLRPLANLGANQDSYKASRRYEMVDHRQQGLSGFVSVEGGKYTTSRGLAVQVIRHIGRQSQWNVSQIDSSKYILHPCRIGNYDQHLQSLLHRFAADHSVDTIQYYARNYGVEAEAVLDLAKRTPAGSAVLTADGEIMAEVDYVLDSEMVHSLEDLLLRRTGIGWMGRPSSTLLQQATEKLAALRDWSDQEQQVEIHKFVEKHYTLP